MAFLVGGANSLTAGYDIDNSLRFNSADSADLRITPSSAGTEETFTISAWIKKSMVGSSNGDDTYLFSSQADSNNRTVMGVWGDSGGIFFENKISGSSSTVYEAAKRRDPSAWMHCVWAIDTTQGTAANRVKLYVNGTQITTLDNAAGGSADYIAEDALTQWSRAQVNYVGSRAGGNYYDGYMAEVYYIDGSQLTAASFGETDEDSGIWKPKQYSGSFGGESWFLEFKGTGTDADASGIGADTSGEDNHLTVANLAATDQTTDTPTNNFATLRIMYSPMNTTGGTSFAEGNLKFTSGTDSARDMDKTAISNIPVNKGKWYCEIKIGSESEERMGAGPDQGARINGGNNDRYAYIENDGNRLVQDGDGEVNTAFMGNPANASIMMLALDMDNERLYAGNNGSWADGSGNTDESSPTGYLALDTGTMLTNNTDLEGYAVFQLTSHDASTNQSYEMNFGNPSFAISSGNADADGYGNFEYAVPSGYYALCTKNLAEYG